MKFFILPTFDDVIMDGHPIFQSWWYASIHHPKYWMPSIITPSEMGKTENLMFYSLTENAITAVSPSKTAMSEIARCILNVTY